MHIHMKSQIAKKHFLSRKKRIYDKKPPYMYLDFSEYIQSGSIFMN